MLGEHKHLVVTLTLAQADRLQLPAGPYAFRPDLTNRQPGELVSGYVLAPSGQTYRLTDVDASQITS